MPPALAAVIVVVVGGLLFVSLRSHSSSTKAEPSGVTIAGRAEVGKPAPDFTATDLDGKAVSLSSYRGRPLIVDAAAKHGSRLAIVSVMHQDLTRDARSFMRDYHAGWPAINDETNAISSAYGVVGVPQTFFITPDGVVQARVFGITSHSALDPPLKQLLASP